MQARGEHPTAAHELTLCADDARTNRWRQLEAVALQHRGRGSFEVREYPAAVDDFLAALRLREDAGVDEEQIEASRFALEVARSFATTGGPITLMRRPSGPSLALADDAAANADIAVDAVQARSERQDDGAGERPPARTRAEAAARRAEDGDPATGSVPLIALDEVDSERHPAPEPIFARFRRRSAPPPAEADTVAERQDDDRVSEPSGPAADAGLPAATGTPAADGHLADAAPTAQPTPDGEGPATASPSVGSPAARTAHRDDEKGDAREGRDDPRDPSSISGAEASATLWASAARTAGAPVTPAGAPERPAAEEASSPPQDGDIAPRPVTASQVSQTLHADNGVPRGRKQRRDLLWGRFNAASTRRDDD
ncbi:putative Fe-S oxidoreductase [Mycetocola reblochoni REB411]|uniref:Putative Fe-S oxidoreductase n=2 Tax=Mycetocola reblochoni TaxID=331618 RepID=A0A1R4ID40_9MICO|nr:putative Fe-S oxidoreductase [Mycetocola reblochoni REB411]